MDREHADAITASFHQLLPAADTAAALFYGRLFEIAPDLMPLFRQDMREQGRKFVAMLQLIVGSLDDVDGVQPTVAELGRAHAGYGVRPEHYEPVRVALFWALRQTLQRRWTPATERAWDALYRMLAETMQSAARQDA